MKVPPPPEGKVALPAELSLRLLADMLRVRRMEEKCAELYGQQKIRGFLHLYIGEEAVAAGALRALEPQDNVVATYREHGHALLRGVSMDAIMAEMYGKREGCSRGRGGSMHLFDAATRFFGEGAVAEGAFHESMNLAALWALPVAFLCENNRYAMGTALERSEAQTDLCAKAASYGMATLKVDGMDVVAVLEGARRAREHAARQGPIFVEFQTYRFRAHSMFDPELYRDKAEVQAWKARGPIHTFTARLKAQGDLTEERFLALDAAAQAEVDRAVAFAEAGTWEPVADLARDLTTPA